MGPAIDLRIKSPDVEILMVEVYLKLGQLNTCRQLSNVMHDSNHVSAARNYMWVLFNYSIFMFITLYQLDLHNKTCVA